jgi:hypothetical protein
MTPLLRDVRDWLMERTRLLPTRVVSRPPAGLLDEPTEGPPPPEFEEGERPLAPKQYIERSKEIPPDHFPGGGAPHR